MSATISKEIEKVLSVVREIDRNRVSVDDFKEIIGILKDFATTTAKINATEIRAIRKEAQDLMSALETTQTGGIADVKKTVEARLNKALDQFTTLTSTLEKDVRSTMNFVYDKVSKIKEGTDGRDGARGERGRDGKDADPKVVANMVSDELMPFLREELDKLRSEIGERKLGGAGGTSSMGVQFAIGKLAKSETPTGDIDGVNTTYRVQGDIHAVLNFAINGQVIMDTEYTVSGKTITMLTPIPAELSTTAFRMTYI